LRLLFGAALAAAALFAGTTVAAPQAPIAYRVTPEVGAGGLTALRVEMRFRGDLDGKTRVFLPDAWSGATELHRAVGDIQVEGASMTRPESAALDLGHLPRAPITVSYRVRQDFRGAPAAGPTRPFRPATQPGWFTAVGWTVFADVAGRQAQPASFSWGPVPNGWAVASDLDHQPRGVRRTGDLLDSVLVGGRGLQVIERQTAGGRMRIAVHGDGWKFERRRLGDLLGRIADASADFWGDRGEEFFVAMTPLQAPDGGSVQYGLGLGDAFTLWATPEADEASLKHILAHEHQHTWFPSRLGGVRTGPDEPLDYWFSEGFTDFYTLRLLLRSGVWSLEEFTADFNRILQQYASSPARELPNAEIARAFWSDGEVADLPYRRGLLLAALWDDRLRRETNGAADLDDVVRRMSAEAQGRPPAGDAPRKLKTAYRAVGGADLTADYVRFVDGGGQVLLPTDLFGACASVVTREKPAFERGFDVAATSAGDGVVAGVDPEGPAWAAGLRNGMRILRREGGDNADSSVVLAYRVLDGGQEKLISYKPQGRAKLQLQEIVLTPRMDAAQRADCARKMSGS